MSNVFGPKKPLFGPYTYRVKQNSNGDTLIAVYHGSKRIAHIDAFWAYSMRAIEEHEADEKQRGRGKRLVCASDLRALGAEGRYPNVLAVGHAFIDDEAYKGKGIGRAMYEAMMVEGFAVRETRIGGQPGPMFFIPDECKGAGNTSAEAQRVWASLVRDYPSQGTSIRVDAPPVIGSRAPLPNPRRRNPAPKVAYDRDEGELVVPPGYAVRLTKLGRMGSAPERVARLAELVPARETHAFALHPENWAGTFASLTGKDRQKVMSFKPEAIALTPDTLVGEMKIASRYLWHGDDADALAYRDSVRRLADADIRAYRQPELLVPRTNPRRRNSANTREADENVPDCAWCGAACDQPHPYPNRRGEMFCSPAHRSASNRALARVLGTDDDSSPRRRRNPEDLPIAERLSAFFADFDAATVRCPVDPDEDARMFPDVPVTIILTREDGDDYVSLVELHAHPGIRGTGAGTEAMRRILDLADKHDIIVSLIPAPLDKGWSSDRLQRWYASFGFEFLIEDPKERKQEGDYTMFRMSEAKGSRRPNPRSRVRTRTRSRR